MATQPAETLPVITIPDRGMARFSFIPSAPTDIALRELVNMEPRDEFVTIPAGVSELVIQRRMAGDVYVELSGPGPFCIAHFADTPVEAVRGIIARKAA
jgi:hypothetical protein